MPTRLFDSVVQRLVTHVPGCPFPVIEKFVRDSAIEVCERTLVWKYEQPPIRLTPGLHDYDYAPPTQAEVHAFIHVTVSVNSDTPFYIEPLSLEQLYEKYPAWPDHRPEALGQPRNIAHLDADHFVLAPVPDNTDTYDVGMLVALKPLRTATGMDETVLDDIENAVMDGALAALYRLPAKAWTDMKLADYHSRQFIYRTSERRARANLGAGRGSMTIKMRPFGGRSSQNGRRGRGGFSGR
jgi:hypothetical protein